MECKHPSSIFHKEMENEKWIYVKGVDLPPSE